MKMEQQNRTFQPEYYPTAGFGSVAPPWIKADLLMSNPPKPAPLKTAPPSWQWLRRQLGWHLG
ncbi:hypothetical protein [Rheinheimera texasensis]|uniref:hypothetical protein n=1 Tax=Rheinheimera texasensis TaxID=306205 RepID=UPI0032B30A72